MTNIKELEAAGIDYEEGLTRFMDDAELFNSILVSFLDDTTFNEAQMAMNEKNYPQLMECTHAIKGVAGNLSMSRLYKASSELTELLRGKVPFDDKTAEAYFDVLKTAYFDARNSILSACKEKENETANA